MALSGITEQLGRVLGGRYRLVAPIGTGSSAQVFLADDVSLRRRVAVKVLHPALAGDEAFLRRFRAEARAAAALSHPNLMAVYDWGEDDGPYLVLELLGGGSLRALLDTGGRLSVAQAAAVGLDAARALGAAHRRGFVHRDIKPANLLFGDDGRLRIADFGLARALSEAAWTEPGDGLVGTARYAAPEQASSPRVDGKADVYALGLVLIEAVTGSVPLTADTGLGTLMRRVDTPVPVPEALGPLRPLLLEVGRANPADRPDAEGVERGLLEVARALDPPGPLSLPGAVALAVPSDPTLVAAPRTPPQARHGRGARSSAPRGAPFDDLAPAEVHGSAPPPAVSRAPAGGGTTAAGSRAPGSPAGDRAPEARGPAPTEADGAAGGDGDVPAWLAGDRAPGARGPAPTPADGDGGSAGGDGSPAGEGRSGGQADAGTAGGAWSPGAVAPPRGRRTRLRRRGAATATEVAPDGRPSRRSRRRPAGAPAAEVPGTGRRRWRRWALAALLVVVLAGAGWAGVRAYQEAQPTRAAVPAVTTLERGAAEAELAAAEAAVEDGLDWLVVVEEEHSEVVLAGFVIDQDPGPGTVVEDGEEVRLVVSLGPPPRTVPDLFNRTVAEARKDIAERELAFGRTEQLHVEDVAEGRVISWSVEGADRPAEVPKGSEVDLVVSLGPAPREVPDLAGAPAEEATAALDALGLVVAVAEDFSSTVDAGRVIATTPEEGTTLARGDTVQVVVSRGPDLVRVPDLSAMTESEAIAALRAAGLVAGDANGPAGGEVFASEPRAGASVERGTRVDLFRR